MADVAPVKDATRSGWELVAVWVTWTGLGLFVVMLLIAWFSDPEQIQDCDKNAGFAELVSCKLDVDDPFIIKVRTADLFEAERQRLADAKTRALELDAKAKSGVATDIQAARTARTDLAAMATSTTLVLFVDGTPVPAQALIAFDGDFADNTVMEELKFHLQPPLISPAGEGQAWAKLLAGDTGFGKRLVTVALGDKGSALPRRGTEIGNVTLAVFRPWVVGFAGVGLLMIAFGLAGQFWRTAMLRERTPVVNEGLPPFSLAKVQIGWWGLLVVGGFLFLFFATGEYNGIVTSSTLGLIGISGLTLIVARGIDQQTEAPADRTTNGFFHDLVTDGDSNNVALQRLQMVVWNGILGLIFVYLSLKRLTFPEFDQNLLVLAGLVSATYAGFKIPENAAKKEEDAKKGAAKGGAGGGGGGGQGAGQGGAGQGGDGQGAGQGAQGAGQNGDGQGARDRGAGD